MMNIILSLTLTFGLLFSISAQAETRNQDILFILDYSGSMNAPLENQKMIDWARKAIKSSVANLPEDAKFGIRAYGHRESKDIKEKSCLDTQLIRPISAGNRESIDQLVDSISPRGWTPIAYTLEQTAKDLLPFIESTHSIILISDGIETCGGDPLAAAQKLRDQGIDFKIFTIGFNVDEKAKAQLESLAQNFDGTYSDARNGASLQKELIEITKKSYLIEKENKENRIRGGNSEEDAVEIKSDVIYQLDHHQRKGEFDFFKIQIPDSTEVSIRVEPEKKCVSINGNQTIEKIDQSRCKNEAYKYSLKDSSGKTVAELKSTSIDSMKYIKPFMLGKGDTYYLIAGSSLGDMHRDHKFSISLKVKGDINSNIDAGNKISTALEITPGLYEENFLSKTDSIDIYKLKVKKNDYLKIAVSNNQGYEYGKIYFEVLDELGGIVAKSKWFRRDESQKLKSEPFDESQEIYIRIKSEGLNRKTQVYSLGFALKKSEK